MPPQVPHDLVELDQEDDIIYGDHSPNVGGDNTSYKKEKEANTFYMTFSVKTKTGCNTMLGP